MKQPKWSYTAPADNNHRFEINQISEQVDEVADFFQNYPGSLPDQEEDIENRAREVLGRFENFVTGRWGA